MKKDSDKMEYCFLRTSQQLSSYKSNSRIHQQEPWDCALVWGDKWMEGQIKMDCGKDRWLDGGERQWPWWAKLVHHVCSSILSWWLLWHTVWNPFEKRHGLPQKECFYRSIMGRYPVLSTREIDESLSASLLSKPYFSIRPPLRLEEGKREDLWICSLAH